MLLYTWKDVERKLLLNKNMWGDAILDFEIYFKEIIIHHSSSITQIAVKNTLRVIFTENYDSKNNRICFDLSDKFLDVSYEEDNDTTEVHTAIPLFKNVLYQQSAYYDKLIETELPGVPVLAFHSYKGGVGRTLSLLAFVKAWSALKDLKTSKKLLIVDADIEAPGITWLTSNEEESAFSFLDLLEITQENDDVQKIIDLIAEKISELTIKIETEKSIVEHIVLPTYRYIEQLLDMYSSPESLALSFDKKYILAEVLSKLGEKVNADYVLVDLRAGLSEFSAPLLFDPRVKKFLVTSTSYQSIEGTKILLSQLSKGLPLNGETQIPEIFLTMVKENVDTADMISEMIAIYDKCATDDNLSITDDIITQLPFASELVHLDSMQKIMKSLNGRDFYKNILEIVENTYVRKNEVSGNEKITSRDEIIRSIHIYAENQITAEGNGALKVLMTESIQNLIKKYKNIVPNTVIMGAKGSGKTFLYWEIVRNKYWDKFLAGMSNNSGTENGDEKQPDLLIPLLASGNVGASMNY